MTGRRGLAIVALGVLAACSSPEGRLLPPPSSTSSTIPVTTTARPDYAQIVLPALEGQTTTTTPISAGNAEIVGSVSGPTGLIPGAVVRFERLVGDAVQRTDITTGADGRFRLAGVPGGRYRVRAYFPPLLAMDGPEVFFLSDGDARDLQLSTREYTGFVVDSGVTPSAPFVGQGVNLVVRVTQRVVDGDGIGREVGVEGAGVSVSVSGWTVVDPVGRRTDGNGNAVFEFSCDTVTNVTATALVDVGAGPQGYGLDVPPCGPRPTTTTSTTVVDPDTSTTAVDDPDATTTTTRP